MVGGGRGRGRGGGHHGHVAEDVVEDTAGIVGTAAGTCRRRDGGGGGRSGGGRGRGRVGLPPTFRQVDAYGRLAARRTQRQQHQQHLQGQWPHTYGGTYGAGGGNIGGYRGTRGDTVGIRVLHLPPGRPLGCLTLPWGRIRPVPSMLAVGGDVTAAVTCGDSPYRACPTHSAAPGEHSPPCLETPMRGTPPIR